MPVFADLSPYSSLPMEQKPGRVLAVGWLGSAVPFPRGPFDRGLLDCLLRLCRRPANRTRGFQVCDLCQPAVRGAPRMEQMAVDGKPVLLGDAEVHVAGEQEIIYVAPTLICHYVEAHEYMPPSEFIEALRA